MTLEYIEQEEEYINKCLWCIFINPNNLISMPEVYRYIIQLPVDIIKLSAQLFNKSNWEIKRLVQSKALKLCWVTVTSNRLIEPSDFINDWLCCCISIGKQIKFFRL